MILSKEELHAAHTAFYTQQQRLQALVNVKKRPEHAADLIMMTVLLDRVADKIVDDAPGEFPFLDEELIAAQEAFATRKARLESYVEGMHRDVKELPDMRKELVVMTAMLDRIREAIK